MITQKNFHLESLNGDDSVREVHKILSNLRLNHNSTN